MAHSKTEITIATNGTDTALAKVFVKTVEQLGAVKSGESQKFDVAIDAAERGGQVQEQAKAAVPELTPAQIAARAIGQSMKDSVQSAELSAPSRVAQVGEMQIPDPDAKGIV